MESIMSNEQENKAIAERWLEGLWGSSWTPGVVDDLAAPDIRVQFLLQAPRRGRTDVKNYLVELHRMFDGFEFRRTAHLMADGDYVVAGLEGGGTHVGPAFVDPFVGYLRENSRRQVHLAGTTVLRIKEGKIAEETTRMTWVVLLPRFQKRGLGIDELEECTSTSPSIDPGCQQ
jgi:SnoaL-like polyketide cyclase